MMEFDDDEINNFIEKSQEELDTLYCDYIYEEVLNGKYTQDFGIIDAINHFSKTEQYEKCIVLKKALTNE